MHSKPHVPVVHASDTEIFAIHISQCEGSGDYLYQPAVHRAIFSGGCKLKEWFDKEGRNTPSVSISREVITMGRTDVRKTISQIRDERQRTSEKPD